MLTIVQTVALVSVLLIIISFAVVFFKLVPKQRMDDVW